MANKAGLKVSREGLEKFRERYEIELPKADFGNARTVRNILDEAISKHALRLTKDKKAKENLLTSADISSESRKNHLKTKKYSKKVLHFLNYFAY